MKVAETIGFYSRPDTIAELVVWCPGCSRRHYPIVHPFDDHPTWTWNGSLDAPTLRPSLLVNAKGTYPDRPRCHSWITDGWWTFLDDSTHALAGQIVPMVPVIAWPAAPDEP